MATKTYEQIRLQRIEENKKRMEELNLNALFHNLKKSPKPSSQAKRKIVQKKLDFVLQVRRSGRNTDKPAPVYRDVVDYGIGKPTNRSAKSKASSRSAGDFPVASAKEREIATEKAGELELSLGDDFPCFIKSMLHSHVNVGFCLGLPSYFCKTYMPKKDAQVTLVDEEGGKFETTYLAMKVGLSGGWVGLALLKITNSLMEMLVSSS